MNRIEMFTADTFEALETVIRLWCSDERLEPISISVVKDLEYYRAAVVVKESDND